MAQDVQDFLKLFFKRKQIRIILKILSIPGGRKLFLIYSSRLWTEHITPIYKEVGFMSARIIFLYVLFLLLFPSCTQEPIHTETIISAAPATEPMPSMTPEPEPYWREFRESIDGWGIAVPYGWRIEPEAEESVGFRRIRINNYNISFFRAHSEKGWWTSDVIENIMSMEIVKFYDVSNTASLEEAIREVYKLDAGYERLLSSKVVLINGNQALFFTLSVSSGIEPYDGYMFRIGNDAMLVFYTNPNSSWKRPEATAILNSIVLDREREIVLPGTQPSAFLSGE